MDKEAAYKRFEQAIEYLKSTGTVRTHDDIAEKMGMKRPHISAAINGNFARFTDGFLRRFASAYSDFIREEWLIDGIGPMATPDPDQTPLIGMTASAGFMDAISIPDYADNLTRPSDFIPDHDLCIRASGDSMEPVIESGDILYCRLLHDSARLPIDEICVFDTKGGAMVKVLADVRYRGSDHARVLLRSFNPDYPDQWIQASDILRVAQVVALIRPLI